MERETGDGSPRTRLGCELTPEQEAEYLEALREIRAAGPTLRALGLPGPLLPLNHPEV